MHTWQLQYAKAKLTEVVDKANTSKPQMITVRGKLKAVVMGIEDYLEISKAKPSLVNFLQNSPLKQEKITITRDHSKVRKINL